MLLARALRWRVQRGMHAPAEACQVLPLDLLFLVFARGRMDLRIFFSQRSNGVRPDDNAGKAVCRSDRQRGNRPFKIGSDAAIDSRLQADASRAHRDIDDIVVVKDDHTQFRLGNARSEALH